MRATQFSEALCPRNELAEQRRSQCAASQSREQLCPAPTSNAPALALKACLCQARIAGSGASG
ncbi:MAG TPA: hypothetical protein VGP32_05470, partial [Steroidobacteraceae bacterium]|nr:hypothetical protein [Steroidobacteraceae bacterium]